MQQHSEQLQQDSCAKDLRQKYSTCIATVDALVSAIGHIFPPRQRHNFTSLKRPHKSTTSCSKVCKKTTRLPKSIAAACYAGGHSGNECIP
eukprot:3638785-Amphidinium_carterae.1